MKDWRRMNVSFTRARSKLVIFGSRKTLQREPLLAQFFDLMETQGWILALPPGADIAHARVFEGCLTPAKRGLGSGVGLPIGPLAVPQEVAKDSEGTRRTITGKENMDAHLERPAKRMRMKTQAVGKSVGPGVIDGPKMCIGVLKRRSILQDLIANES